MSDQNDGNQWNKGYEPPAGSMADEQRRAAEAAQRQQEQQYRQQQADDLRRQEQADRENHARTSTRNTSRRSKKTAPQNRGSRSSNHKNKTATSSGKFNYGWATIGFIAIGMYTYSIMGLEGWPSIIAAFIGGAIIGYIYKLLIILAIIGGLYYFFIYDKKDNDNSLTTLAPTEKVHTKLTDTPPLKKTIPPTPKPIPPPKAKTPTAVEAYLAGDGPPLNIKDLQLATYTWEEATRIQKKSITTVEASYLYSKAIAADATSFRKIDVQHQMTQNGQPGMLITSTFAVKNLNGMPAKVHVNIYYGATGKGVQTSKFYERNPITRQLSIAQDIKPLYDDALYTDFKIFVPYTSLTIPSQKNTVLTLNLTVQYQNYLWGKGSEHHSFTWN